MGNSERIKRYFRKAKEEHGTVLSEFYFSLADRTREYGDSVTCADCVKRCRVAGVSGEYSFWCGDKINK